MDAIRRISSVHGRRGTGTADRRQTSALEASIGGKQEEWDAEITEQIPDQRIAWRSQRGAKNNGMLTFSSIANNKSKINLRLEYEPQGAIEKTGDAVGVVSQRVEGDLKRFKEFIESRGQETGAWRGKVS